MEPGSNCYFCNGRRTLNSKENKIKVPIFRLFFIIPKPQTLQLPSAPTVGSVSKFICDVHQLLHLVSGVIRRVALSHIGKRISLRGHLNLESNHSSQSGSEGRQSKRLFIFLTLSGVRLTTKCQPHRRSCH